MPKNKTPTYFYNSLALLSSPTALPLALDAHMPVRRSTGVSKPANSSRAVATLMRVQLSAASPGGSTARTNVLLVRRDIR